MWRYVSTNMRVASALTAAELREVRRDWKETKSIDLARRFDVWPSSMANLLAGFLEHEKHRQRQLKRAKMNAGRLSTCLGYTENDYTPESLTGEERYILRHGPKYSIFD